MAVNEFEIKKQICDIGKRIYNRNMVAANDGNISVKLDDHTFLCTPTGVSKGFMTPESARSMTRDRFFRQILDSSLLLRSRCI